MYGHCRVRHSGVRVPLYSHPSARVRCCTNTIIFLRERMRAIYSGGSEPPLLEAAWLRGCHRKRCYAGDITKRGRRGCVRFKQLDGKAAAEGLRRSRAQILNWGHVVERGLTKYWGQGDGGFMLREGGGSISMTYSRGLIPGNSATSQVCCPPKTNVEAAALPQDRELLKRDSRCNFRETGVRYHGEEPRTVRRDRKLGFRLAPHLVPQSVGCPHWLGGKSRSCRGRRLRSPTA